MERRKICAYRDSNPFLSAVQPVACRYTDCTIPAHDPGFLLGLFFDPEDAGDMSHEKPVYFQRTKWRCNPNYSPWERLTGIGLMLEAPLGTVDLAGEAAVATQL
jgi:hypothetical protein